jgi:hypothetical protein
MHLSLLHNDEIEYICRFLSVLDILSMSLTSKKIRTSIINNIYVKSKLIEYPSNSQIGWNEKDPDSVQLYFRNDPPVLKRKRIQQHVCETKGNFQLRLPLFYFQYIEDENLFILQEYKMKHGEVVNKQNETLNKICEYIRYMIWTCGGTNYLDKICLKIQINSVCMYREDIVSLAKVSSLHTFLTQHTAFNQTLHITFELAKQENKSMTIIVKDVLRVLDENILNFCKQFLDSNDTHDQFFIKNY